MNPRQKIATGVLALALGATGCASGSTPDAAQIAAESKATETSARTDTETMPTTGLGEDITAIVTPEQLDRIQADGDIFVATSAEELLGYSTDVITGTVLEVLPGRYVSVGDEEDNGVYSTAIIRIATDAIIKGPHAGGGSIALVEIAVDSLDDRRDQVTEDLSGLVGANVLVAARESTQNFEPVTAIDGVDGRYVNALPQGLLVELENGQVLTLQFGGTYLTDLNGITSVDDVIEQAATDRAPTWQLPEAEGGEETLSGTDGPVMRHTGPYWDDAMLESVGGVLALEGDCLYLDRTEWGQRYPVIWPADTSWDEENQVVMPPAGEPLSIGQSVGGDGGYMASGAVEGFAGPRA